MLLSELCKEFPSGPHPPIVGILQSLANSFAEIGESGDVEQPLISFGILDHGPRLALDGEYHRALGLLELLHKVAGAAAEGGERLDVFGDIEHKEASFMDSTFLGAHKAAGAAGFSGDRGVQQSRL